MTDWIVCNESGLLVAVGFSVGFDVNQLYGVVVPVVVVVVVVVVVDLVVNTLLVTGYSGMDSIFYPKNTKI